MKQVSFALALAAGLGLCAPAFAARTVQPVNGTVAASTMPDGNVMLEIKIPKQQFVAMNRDMKIAGKNICTIDDSDPAAPDTMVLVCGVAKPVAP